MKATKTQNLIAEFEKKAPKTPFINIPFATQKALVNFMAIRGDAWSDLIPEKFSVLSEWNDYHWKGVIGEIEKTHGSRLFSLFEVPATLLTDHIFNSCDEICSEHKNWTDYHDWYVSLSSQSEVVDIRGCPACIYTEDSDVLESGWDYLHAYVASGYETIPLISFCS